MVLSRWAIPVYNACLLLACGRVETERQCQKLLSPSNRDSPQQQMKCCFRLELQQ